MALKSFEILGFPDNRFDTIPLLDIIKAVEIKKQEIKPEIVFTHHAHDLNIDHRKTFQAVLTACRPMQDETVREIYSFEVPSSTEWQVQTSVNVFLPTLYITIAESHLKAKIDAMEIYTSEVRDSTHPRSENALKLLAEWRGLSIGTRFAECFEMVRRIL
ncbi:MAG: LmbE family protein [Candidatus Magnetoglobus multicellularis str. Araruama]|uniref:LmbE family protein n=1 Tax=Candidatus Magnetoglobus multicellularis str. Araruama TaxID=890399 RepID=A0A1V1NW03_9BACT|nr:MAG: LmbE family protein [Candidatus Magnetoglobus multicellularis str. Araruama]